MVSYVSNSVALQLQILKLFRLNQRFKNGTIEQTAHSTFFFFYTASQIIYDDSLSECVLVTCTQKETSFKICEFHLYRARLR